MNPRITSIDALRGLVMFIMIFVNDLASVGDIVPDCGCAATGQVPQCEIKRTRQLQKSDVVNS